MADFHQTGVITSLHRLGEPDLDRLEGELVRYAEERPIALVLPSLYAEIHGPALKRIVEELSRVPYLRQCVVSLSGQAGPREYDEMRRLFDSVRCTDGSGVTLIWNRGPRVEALYEALRSEGLDPGQDGKGRANWIAYGYVLACHQARVVATHDCDILDYRRDLLARLCYPTANPNMSYEFAKGYYSRVSDRMHGRVTRLFMTPLMRSMKTVLGPVPLLEYLESFRYPLAGECSMTTELVRANRIPADWGLEVGMLAEVYRNCSLKRICQVELVENYDHKHQELSAGDPRRGLHRMVRDIAASLIRNLASYGVEFDSGFLNTLIAAYVRTAQDAIARYSDDAKLNGLAFDRHEEEVAVETFSGALRAAGLDFVHDPMGGPQIPNWSRVVSAMPDFLDDLRSAVETDAQQGG
ncbi:MAG: glycosyl transferase [Deltaproteobacteria bacterium]|jgi:glucosyl-3-phosphoglycerate synthase|nr:glycosyl transferase [Deltaproteobacteria bacterium]